MSTDGWVPTFRCCWCGAEFITREIDRVVAWICPTEECAERQIAKRMLDTTNKLFYLPLPKGVELEDAIESQNYGAICIGGHRNSAKSHMLRMIVYKLCRRFAEFSVLFLRRSMPELRLNHMRFAIRETKRIGAKYMTNSVQ